MAGSSRGRSNPATSARIARNRGRPPSGGLRAGTASRSGRSGSRPRSGTARPSRELWARERSGRSLPRRGAPACRAARGASRTRRAGRTSSAAGIAWRSSCGRARRSGARRTVRGSRPRCGSGRGSTQRRSAGFLPPVDRRRSDPARSLTLRGEPPFPARIPRQAAHRASATGGEAAPDASGLASRSGWPREPERARHAL